MMHEITVSFVNVTKSSRFGLAESYHGQENEPGLHR